MNKYAEGYFNSLLETLKNYKPFNSLDATSTGIGAGAAAGAAIGGTIGAVKNPGYDEYGQKKSRIKEALKGMLLGGAAGGVTLAAVPALGQRAIEISRRFSDKPVDGMPDIRNQFLHETLSKTIPNLSVVQLKNLLGQISKLKEQLDSVKLQQNKGK